MRLAPVPRLAVLRAGCCFCGCHSARTADVQACAQLLGTPPSPRVAINGLGDTGADVAAALDAAVACDRCRRHHCPALLNDVPELRRRVARPAVPALVFGAGEGEE